MITSRVIPCLELVESSLVKTIKYRTPNYIGDPINTCRIFNELEVDELMILGIRNSLLATPINYQFLEKLASECFMPLAYGGGIRTVDDARRIFSLGFEKIVLNSALFDNLTLLNEIVKLVGSQSVVVAIDTKKDIWGKYSVFSKSGTCKEKIPCLEWVKIVEECGAGELLINDISADGTWNGMNIQLIQSVAESVNIPVIAHCGAGCKKHVEDAVNVGKASAVAIGSMVVYQKKDMGVLINYQHDYAFNDRTEKR